MLFARQALAVVVVVVLLCISTSMSTHISILYGLMQEQINSRTDTGSDSHIRMDQIGRAVLTKSHKLNQLLRALVVSM